MYAANLINGIKTWIKCEQFIFTKGGLEVELRNDLIKQKNLPFVSYNKNRTRSYLISFSQLLAALIVASKINNYNNLSKILKCFFCLFHILPFYSWLAGLVHIYYFYW